MIAIVDVETTGLDPATDRVIEIAVQLTSEDFSEVFGSCNYLMWDASYPKLTPEIQELTGITEDLLLQQGKPPSEVMPIINDMLSSVDAVVAYNEQFDSKFITKEILEVVGLTSQRQWLCAMMDHKPNYKLKSWKLMHVALDHGVPVDPSKLHRAIADVELTRQMLVASKGTAQTLQEYRLSPWVYLKAKVKKPWEDNGVSTQSAKDHGFAWEKAKGDSRIFEKMWVKRIKEIDLKQQKELPFETVIIGGSNANN